MATTRTRLEANSRHTVNDIWWVDLNTHDIAAARTFLHDLMGWEAEASLDPDGNQVYSMFKLDDLELAGMAQLPAEMSSVPPLWNSYVLVDSVDETIEKVTANGGTVMMPAMDVMESGRMA